MVAANHDDDDDDDDSAAAAVELHLNMNLSTDYLPRSELVIHKPNMLWASNLLAIPNSSQPSAAANITWAGHCAVPSISMCTAMRDIK